MKKHHLLFSVFIIILSVLLVGCNKNSEAAPIDSTKGTEIIDTTETNSEEIVFNPHDNRDSDSDFENGESTDSDNGTAEADTQEDTVDSEGDYSEGTETESIIYTYEPSKNETAEVSTADTSGMDFTFSEEAPTTASDNSKTEAPEETKPVYPPVPSSGMIIEGGTYLLSRAVTDTMITVNAAGSQVNIILDGATIVNSNGPAIYVRAASKVTLTLAEGTHNTVSDGSSYSLTESGSKLDGAIFSKGDLVINGNGTLTVNGNYKHGIVSKDDLVISSGNLNVTSQKIGINGKDCVKINGGSIKVNAGTSGITSDNNTDATKGYVHLYGGKINITAGNDGIAAQTVINIENVDLTLKTGGGCASTSNLSGSFKGLKSGSDIYITGGRFNVDSKDDSIHSNGTVAICGGTYTLLTADDAIHADTDLGVSGASTKLTIAQCSEGIEATNLVITGGNVYITASENGLDANGTLSILGGEVRINITGNAASTIFKFEESAKVSGGFFFGIGTGSKQQSFGTASTQCCISADTGIQSEGSFICLTDSNGSPILSGTADNSFTYVTISCPEIQKGQTYTLTAGSYSITVTAN